MELIKSIGYEFETGDYSRFFGPKIQKHGYTLTQNDDIKIVLHEVIEENDRPHYEFLSIDDIASGTPIIERVREISIRDGIAYNNIGYVFHSDDVSKTGIDYHMKLDKKKGSNIDVLHTSEFIVTFFNPNKNKKTIKEKKQIIEDTFKKGFSDLNRYLTGLDKIPGNLLVTHKKQINKVIETVSPLNTPSHPKTMLVDTFNKMYFVPTMVSPNTSDLNSITFSIQMTFGARLEDTIKVMKAILKYSKIWINHYNHLVYISTIERQVNLASKKGGTYQLNEKVRSWLMLVMYTYKTICIYLSMVEKPEYFKNVQYFAVRHQFMNILKVILENNEEVDAVFDIISDEDFKLRFNGVLCEINNPNGTALIDELLFTPDEYEGLFTFIGEYRNIIKKIKDGKFNPTVNKDPFYELLLLWGQDIYTTLYPIVDINSDILIEFRLFDEYLDTMMVKGGPNMHQLIDEDRKRCKEQAYIGCHTSGTIIQYINSSAPVQTKSNATRKRSPSSSSQARSKRARLSTPTPPPPPLSGTPSLELLPPDSYAQPLSLEAAPQVDTVSRGGITRRRRRG